MSYMLLAKKEDDKKEKPKTEDKQSIENEVEYLKELKLLLKADLDSYFSIEKQALKELLHKYQLEIEKLKQSLKEKEAKKNEDDSTG